MFLFIFILVCMHICIVQHMDLDVRRIRYIKMDIIIIHYRMKRHRPFHLLSLRGGTIQRCLDESRYIFSDTHHDIVCNNRDFQDVQK